MFRVKRRAKLLSLDVWDTVLRRDCHPDEVKLAGARRMLLKYFHELKPEYRDAFHLLDARRESERDIGLRHKEQGLDDEYRLDEVLAETISKAFGEVDEAELQRVVKEALAFELSFEARICRPDKNIAKLINGIKHERLILISDFYMPREDLCKLVEPSLGKISHDDVHVSCDHKLNKRSGKLFPAVTKNMPVAPREHVHVGDNPASDVSIPKAQGIQAQHYFNVPEEAKRRRLEKKFSRRRESIIGYVGDIRRDLVAAATFPGLSGRQAKMYRLGLRYAPLFAGLVLFVTEETLKAGLPAVYYFTREGEFFARVHEVLGKEDPLGTPFPEARILEVSRLATFGPSLREVSTEELMRLWNQYSIQSMGALLKTLNFDPEDFREVVGKHGLHPNEAVTYPWQDERVQAFLDDPSFRVQADPILDENRRLLLGYLQQKGITPESKKIAIVDIGWRGTIQDNLAQLLPQTQITGMYLGLQNFLNPQPANAEKLAYGPDENKEGLAAHRLLRFVSPLEMLANSPLGTTLGYRESHGVVKAVRRADAAENAVHERLVRWFQEGVLAGTRRVSGHVFRHALSAEELRGHALELMAELAFHPPKPIAEAYFELVHDETFGVGRFVTKGMPFPWRSFAKGLLSFEDRTRFIHTLEEAGWPQGYLRLKRMPWLAALYNKRVLRLGKD